MIKFVISWKMRSEERSFDEKTHSGFWSHQLSTEWKLKCFCGQNKQRSPLFIEVHRKSLAGEIMISGYLEIIDDKSRCPSKKKFISLLEDNCPSSSIDLKYPCNAKIPPPKFYFVTGEMTISARTKDSYDLTELVSMSNMDYFSLRELSNDLGKLLIEKSPSADVNLKCGDVSIPAHKNILSARSPVFKAMFTSPWKEAMDHEVVIEDAKAPVLQAMVKYLYTGKIECLSLTLAINLLFLANKYQIVCLENACSEYLKSNMSMKNVTIILGCADSVSPDLKNFAIDFICNNCTDYSALEKRKDWIDLKEINPTLVLEIFSGVIKFQEEKLKVRI